MHYSLFLICESESSNRYYFPWYHLITTSSLNIHDLPVFYFNFYSVVLRVNLYEKQEKQRARKAKDTKSKGHP